MLHSTETVHGCKGLFVTIDSKQLDNVVWMFMRNMTICISATVDAELLVRYHLRKSLAAGAPSCVIP